jgi:predicted AlkP superfamily phosphohydrolase/phosphomutase
MIISLKQQNKKNTPLFLIIILELSIIFLLIKGSIYVPDLYQIYLMSKIKNPKIFLIGIDGAEWNVINPLINEGKLPNFKKFINNGSSGYLISPQCYTPMSWTEIATGKTFDKHGIKDFTKGHLRGDIFSSRKEDLITSTDIKSKRVWNILNEHNKTTGIYQWIITWPPEKVNGFMISDWLAQGEPKSYPLEFFNITKNKSESNITLFLLENYTFDFFAAVNYNIRGLTGYLWKYWEPEKFNITNKTEIEKYRFLIMQGYKSADKVLETIDKKYGDNATVFIVSDHGTKATEPHYQFVFNSLFKEIGLLNYSDSSGIVNINSGVIYQCSTTFKYNKTYIGRFCFLDKNVDKQNITEILSKTKYQGTNESLFFKILIKDEEVEAYVDTNSPYFKPFYSDNFSYKINPYIVLTLPNDNAYKFNIGPEFTGDHPLGTNGIIIVKGSMIKENYIITNATTYDITPTVLYLYDIPIPKDMDGRVLAEIIKPEYLLLHPIKYTDESSQWERKEEIPTINETIVQQIKERLRELGYVN